jgi:hypothetical protein
VTVYRAMLLRCPPALGIVVQVHPDGLEDAPVMPALRTEQILHFMRRAE